MKKKVQRAFRESIIVKEKFLDKNLDRIVEVARLIAQAFSDGHKVILFGNGGSATDASHIAAEFVGRFKMDRPGLNAISLNTNTAVITAIANDFGYADVFARQLKAMAGAGDIVIGISTSGESKNVVRAIEVARKKKLTTVAMTGAKGGKLGEKADYVFRVPSQLTARIQETHITLGHVLCQVVEEILFEAPRKKEQ